MPEDNPVEHTPDPPKPDAPTPHPDTPPTVAPVTPTETAPHHTQDDDMHRALASLTQTVAELQSAVSGLVADGQPVKATDPSPKRKPWTHRGGR